jgi:predicted DNA-binding transcriptional regulator YafY
MRNAALSRTLRLLTLLQRGRYSLASLAQESGVSPRTVRRDLELLASVGFAVEQTERAGVWHVPGGLCPVCARESR